MSILSTGRGICFLALTTATVLCPQWALSLEKVRIGVSVRNVVIMPFYFAKDKGIFEKNGLDVEIIQMRSDLQVAGLISGELDFMSGPSVAIIAISRGVPLKIVGILYRVPLYSLVTNRRTTNPKDLYGKKLAVSRIGSDSYFHALLMLEKSGADGKKVTFIQTGSTILSLHALQESSVEGAILGPPFTGMASTKGFNILKRSQDVIESAPFNGLVTSRLKIQNQPEKIKNALKALLEALSFIRQDRRRAVAYILENFKISQEVAEESYKDIVGVMIDNMIMPEDRLKNYLEFAHNRGIIGKLMPASEVVDYSLLKGLK